MKPESAKSPCRGEFIRPSASNRANEFAPTVKHSSTPLLRAAALLLLLGGCSALRTADTPPPAFYALDSVRITAQAPVSPRAPSLVISPPHAAAGFDSQRIIYLRTPYQREYFAHSEWVDTPARMLAPLLVSSLENAGMFRAVVGAPTAAGGDLRLDTEILRLEQDFTTTPHAVRFVLRAWLMDNATRRVLAWGEFEETTPTASDDPYGGVRAANLAVQGVLGKLAEFSRVEAGKWLSGAKPAEIQKKLQPD